MNTAIIILGVFIAFFRASSSEPTEISRQLIISMEECTRELSLDNNEVINNMKIDVVPEDSSNAVAFYSCFSKKLHLVTEDGDTDFEKLSPIVQDILTHRLGDVEDADALAKTIAIAAIEHCKDTPKAEDVGLTAIKIRNCIRAFSRKQ